MTEQGENRIDLKETLRREILAELSSSGGIPYGRLSMEALFLMPRAFVEIYADIFHRALREGIGREAGPTDENVVRRIDSKYRGKRIGAGGGGQGGGKKYRTYWSVKNENVLAAKEQLDRDLMRAAQDALRNSGKGAVRCSGTKCRKFLKESWQFCPHCGTRRTPDGDNC
jgi:hypothetical protein